MKLKLLIALFTFVLIGCEMEKVSISTKNINENWTFHQEGEVENYTATVPGCVHTDLINNNMIEDPFFGTNEKNLQWIGKKNWIYKTNFNLNTDLLAKSNINFVFKGLDTYADVYLNDSLILSADNMFREWKIDCKKYLKENDNSLQIKFRNVFDENMPKWENAPFRLTAYDNNDQADTMLVMYSRKAQFHYGWDWGPRFITAGIWRPIYLEAWDELDLEAVQIIQDKVSKEKAELRAVFEIRSSINQKADVIINIPEANLSFEKNVELAEGENQINIDFAIDNPKLWWSNGLGEQFLYNFELKVKNENDLIDTINEKIGIRSLEVIREEDEFGKSFYVKLNGVPVFMKGANYIPQDNFQNRVGFNEYDFIIKSAAEANMNMLRVWGGGIYEEDIFYDLCDKYGILVWQDFMFACAMYPADDDFNNNVTKELIDNVKRIRNHPSLALYCGNNEVNISWYSWGWKDKYSEDIQKIYEKNLENLFYSVVPNALAQADSTRYYHPSSPIAGFKDSWNGDGDMHYWGVWHGKEKFDKFYDNIARFMSEYGFQSYPESNTINKFTNPEDRELHSEVMLSHQRCMSDARKDNEYGNRLIETYMDYMYKKPKDFKSYVYVSQLLQAEGIKKAIEIHRRNMPYCMGTLYWQINDCWPVASWSSIDHYKNWKALHYFAMKAYSDLIISGNYVNDSLNIHVISDRLDKVEGLLNISVRDFSGKEISNNSFQLFVNANSSKKYISIEKEKLLKNVDESKVYVILEFTDSQKTIASQIFYFVDPGKLNLVNPELDYNVISDGKNTSIELTSNSLAKNVWLSIEDRYLLLSDNYFDVFPGVKKIISVKSEIDKEVLMNKLKAISLIDTY